MSPSEALAWAFGVVIPENLSISEAVSWFKDTEIQSETLSFSEALYKLVGGIYPVSENLGISESLSFLIPGLHLEQLTMSENLIHSDELPEILWRPSG